MPNNQLLGDLVADIYSCTTLDERFVVFGKHLQKLGFDGGSYTFIPKVVSETQLNYPPVFVNSELFPDSFIEQYIADRFDEHDFTIRAIQDNIIKPMGWQESIQSDYLTQQEKDVLHIAKCDHGINNGISIPVMNGKLGMAGFSIISSMKDAEFRKVKQENLTLLTHCAKVFHDITFSQAYAYHEFIPDVLRNLTDKEKIVLNFVAQGKTMTELGKSNEPVSRRYGEKLLLELRRKFGGVSTHQLIYHISQLKLI